LIEIRNKVAKEKYSRWPD